MILIKFQQEGGFSLWIRFDKNQVQEGRDNCFETVPVLGRHSGDLTPS